MFLYSKLTSAVSKIIANKIYADTQIAQHKANERVLFVTRQQRFDNERPRVPDISANMHTCIKVWQKLPFTLVVLQIIFTFIRLVIVMPIPVPKTRQFGPVYCGKNQRQSTMHKLPAK